MTREILTLQFGHYANFVGTHFWNLQESSFDYVGRCGADTDTLEISHDVLFREGCHRGQVTYTPRLVAVDLHGSLKSLSASGQLYRDEASADTVATWDGEATLHEELRSPKNIFLRDAFGDDENAQLDEKLPLKKENAQGSSTKSKKWKIALEERKREQEQLPLEDTVVVWSDFLGTSLHPRSLHILREYKYADDSNAFDSFSKGRQLFGNRDVLEEFEDRVHFFAEECDYMQGFQCLVDTVDGFGGAAANALHFLNEDYGQKICLCLPLLPARLYSAADPFKVQLNRKVNLLLTLMELHNQCGLLAPLSIACRPWESIRKDVTESL